MNIWQIFLVVYPFHFAIKYMSVGINAFYIWKYYEGKNLGSKKLVQDVNNKNNINDYDDDEIGRTTTYWTWHSVDESLFPFTKICSCFSEYINSIENEGDSDISLLFLITSKAQSHPLWLIYIYTLQKHANMMIWFFLKNILISLSSKFEYHII